MESIDIFYGIWNRKYPELAGRISYSIESVRNMNGSVSTELILECLDDNGEEDMYHKMSYLTKIIFGNERTVAYSFDQQGCYKHEFRIILWNEIKTLPLLL